MGSQCSSASTGTMWSDRFEHVTTRASAFFKRHELLNICRKCTIHQWITVVQSALCWCWIWWRRRFWFNRVSWNPRSSVTLCSQMEVYGDSFICYQRADWMITCRRWGLPFSQAKLRAQRSLLEHVQMVPMSWQWSAVPPVVTRSPNDDSFGHFQILVQPVQIEPSIYGAGASVIVDTRPCE